MSCFAFVNYEASVLKSVLSLYFPNNPRIHLSRLHYSHCNYLVIFTAGWTRESPSAHVAKFYG